MKERIKEFLKPVEGGHYDGLEFGSWFKGSFQRIGLFLLFPIVIILMAIFLNPSVSVWDPEWSFYGVESFFFIIWCILIWKGIIQHWNDIKNHTSR